LTGALRVLGKDLFELFHGVRGLALVLVLPPLLVLVVGQLRTQPFPFRLLVVGVPGEGAAPAGSQAVRRTLALLREVSSLEVAVQPLAVVDPLRVMRQRRLDLLLDVGCTRDDCPPVRAWRLYTADTDPSRFSTLAPLIAGIERALIDVDEAAGTKSEPALLLEGLSRVASPQPRSLFIYYPLVGDRWLFLLPMAVTIVVCFLPFALAVSALMREREARTLEILLAAPGMTPAAVFGGKALLPVAVTLLDFLLMVTLAQSVYRVQLKAGVAEMVLFLVPAAITATMLGLWVSASVSSQAQALVWAALYFLALTLMTGFLLPLGEGSVLVRALSRLLPLTFVLPAVRAWMFGAHPMPGLGEASGWLIFQSVLYGTLAALAFGRALRRV
jgi:ABC-type multidrug transport system permease subunit